MANILGRDQLTGGGKILIEVDADPSAGAGTPAPIGSLAFLNLAGVGSLWRKVSAADTMWLEIVSGGSGANTTLDNLGVTSINASLLFDADQAYNIGSGTEHVAQVFATSIRTGSGEPLSLVSDANIRLATNTGTDQIRVEGPLVIRGTNALANELRFNDMDNDNFISFIAPNLGANTSYVLPAVDGTAGQVLTTDGAGNLSWT